MPPELIAGRYRVEREVGRGGMGSVWLCRDERLGRPVAVKRVGGLPGDSNMHIARALREARHSAALNHPNVVSIFDAFEDEDWVWLVMEYVPSRTLSQIIAAEGSVEPTRAAAIGAQVADGLAAAHAKGTIHRDVKPGNILVRDDGLAKISDFGIARTLGEEQLTRSGLVTGTPLYFSPELARGHEPSPAADVWALGASLYAAVEGRPPYPELTNAIALLTTIASKLPPPPRNAGVLEHPLACMMDPDPETRWTMAQAAQALHDVAGGREYAGQQVEPDQAPTAVLPAPPPLVAVAAQGPDTEPRAQPRELAGDEPRRHWTAVAMVLGAVLIVLAGIGGGYLLLRDTAEGPPGAERRPQGTPATTEPTGSPTGSPEESPEENPEQSPEQSPTTELTPTQTPATGTGAVGSPMEFVQRYYSLLPEDTTTAWSMLASDLQQTIGRDNYEGFWATIDAVQVIGTQPSGSGIVQVSLTYTREGTDEDETRLLRVARTDNGYLITEDLGPV